MPEVYAATLNCRMTNVKITLGIVWYVVCMVIFGTTVLVYVMVVGYGMVWY